MKNIAAVVLAAGMGKRMQSDLPKVLHEMLGRPMIEILLNTLISLGIKKIVVVVGYQADRVQKTLANYADKVEFVLQEEQLGTGHAVMMAEDKLNGFSGDILVLAGDVPFLSSETIQALVNVHREAKAAATVLSSTPPDPGGYGRIIRKPMSNLVDYIVEHKDATDAERQVREINTGTFIFDSRYIFSSLRQVRADNAQKEYYLTDVMQIIHKQGLKAAVHMTDNPYEALGVNSSEQKAFLEARFADKYR